MMMKMRCSGSCAGVLGVFPGAILAVMVLTWGGSPVEGADRLSITRAMERHGSALIPLDENGDCLITDVDYALMIEARLVALYGADLQVGDMDGDGVQTAEDVNAAILAIVRSTFGRLLPGAGAVTSGDVAAVAQRVDAHDPAGDVNFDGVADKADIKAVYDRVGENIDAFSIADDLARDVFRYVSAVRELGRAYFMATECAPPGHIISISNSWRPDHPTWWAPNHQVGVSRTYGDEPRFSAHSESESAFWPFPSHDALMSGTWPANHLLESSLTWQAPADHGTDASAFHWGEEPPSHAAGLSATWPTSHTYAASSTWGADHDGFISRTWWPWHSADDSNMNLWPPLHTEGVSGIWTHGVDVSQEVWPPNHNTPVSMAWGPMHNSGVSQNFPPGHVAAASSSWPGPQPTWPPSHAFAQSTENDEAPVTPGNWPIFPPGHNWWDTALDIEGIVPQFPWPSSGD